MAITLNGIELPSGLLWVDELNSLRVQQNVRQTLNGSVIVYHGSLSNGIPITLEAASDRGWMRRSVVMQLKALFDSAGEIMTLVIRGVSYNVMFKHDTPPAFTATPVVPYSNPSDDDFYVCKLAFITV